MFWMSSSWDKSEVGGATMKHSSEGGPVLLQGAGGGKGRKDWGALGSKMTAKGVVGFPSTPPMCLGDLDGKVQLQFSRWWVSRVPKSLL